MTGFSQTTELDLDHSKKFLNKVFNFKEGEQEISFDADNLSDGSDDSLNMDEGKLLNESCDMEFETES